jgi:hypothetical protein
MDVQSPPKTMQPVVGGWRAQTCSMCTKTPMSLVGAQTTSNMPAWAIGQLQHASPSAAAATVLAGNYGGHWRRDDFVMGFRQDTLVWRASNTIVTPTGWGHESAGPQQAAVQGTEVRPSKRQGSFKPHTDGCSTGREGVLTWKISKDHMGHKAAGLSCCKAIRCQACDVVGAVVHHPPTQAGLLSTSHPAHPTNNV